MPKSQDELLALTPEQKKVFAQLKRAFTACAKAGLYLWDDYGTVSAVNGKGIECITTDASCGDLADRDCFDGFVQYTRFTRERAIESWNLYAASAGEKAPA